MAIIRNPLEWGTDQVQKAASHVASSGRSVTGTRSDDGIGLPSIRPIELSDLKTALAKGVEDFKVYRTDVVFLCVIYPIIGLILGRIAFDYRMLPLLFPAISGFALLGPVAAVGLYEMSRRRERGEKASWSDAFGVIGQPSFIPILLLGLFLLAVFVTWMATAQLIYMLLFGPEPPASASAFLNQVLTTSAGWTMIVVGMGVGFLFALLVLAISVVSFPLLLDREIGLPGAVATSMRAFAKNPVPIAVWGLIVAGSLALGSLPLFLGLIFVMPIMGHATWHLYRRLVTWPSTAAAGEKPVRDTEKA